MSDSQIFLRQKARTRVRLIVCECAGDEQCVLFGHQTPADCLLCLLQTQHTHLTGVNLFLGVQPCPISRCFIIIYFPPLPPAYDDTALGHIATCPPCIQRQPSGTQCELGGPKELGSSSRSRQLPLLPVRLTGMLQGSPKRKHKQTLDCA